MTNDNGIWQDGEGQKPFTPPGNPPGEEQLYAWLNGELPPEEQHEMEQWLGQEGMESDAMEGLKTLGATEAKATVTRLRAKLNAGLTPKRKRKPLWDNPAITLTAIAVVLLLCIMAYLLVHYSLKR